MSEHAEDRPKPPHFPYIGALLCAACLGAAVWTWMTYSYAWEITAAHVGTLRGVLDHGSRPQSEYLCLRGKVAIMDAPLTEDSVAVSFWTGPLEAISVDLVPPSGAGLKENAEVRLYGRLVPSHRSRPSEPTEYWGFAFSTAASRFTGVSIAGLVVGAMGVFVFAVALRHWIERRRAFDDAATS